MVTLLLLTLTMMEHLTSSLLVNRLMMLILLTLGITSLNYLLQRSIAIMNLPTPTIHHLLVVLKTFALLTLLIQEFAQSTIMVMVSMIFSMMDGVHKCQMAQERLKQVGFSQVLQLVLPLINAFLELLRWVYSSSTMEFKVH